MGELQLQMEPGEILRSYRNSDKKFQQVGILAELNAVSKKEMAIWLKEHGCGVDGRLLRDSKQNRTPLIRGLERAAKETQERMYNVVEPLVKTIATGVENAQTVEAPLIQEEPANKMPIEPETALPPEIIEAQNEQEITLERAIDLLMACGWIQKHDMDLADAIKKSIEAENWNPETPNQKVKTDAGKPRLTLVPMQILWDIAAVREWATANKYPDPTNWKQVEPERYHEALLRHVLRYIDDPDGVDEESGLPHLYHVATNVAFLSEMEKGRYVEKENEDRPN